MGDVHPQGNPHYWLDPGNALVIAKALEDRFSTSRPDDHAYFEQRLAAFNTRLAKP